MPRNKEQNEKLKEEKKSLILKEALKQFTAKGLFATRIKDIANGAGIAQGLMYNYFKSKEDIYADLVNNALDKLNAAAEDLEALNAPAEEKIRFAVTQILQTIRESDEFNQTCRLISQASSSSAIPAQTQQAIAQKRDTPYKTFSRIIKEGQDEGTVIDGDPEELAVLFWTAINGLAIYSASRMDQPVIPSADLMTKLFLVKAEKQEEEVCQR